MTETHWTNKLRSNLSTNLHPRMLTPEGYKLKAKDRVKGQLNSEPAQVVDFIYDETYVFEFIIKKIITPMFIGSEAELMELMKKAWLYHEQKNY